MTRLPRAWWPVLLVAAFSLLYLDALRTGFLNDDYLFLEEARRRSLVDWLSSVGSLGHYVRPVSRQLYYEILAPLAGDRAWVFHLVNFGLFLGALALLVDALRALLPLPGVLAGALYFGALPLQRVNLTWISCSQDLLALCFALASLALYRRRHDLAAAAAYLLAVFSKESALPLPLVLAAWTFWVEPRGDSAPSWSSLARRLAPFGFVVLVWVAAVAWARGRTGTTGLAFDPGSFAAAYAHGAQSLLGLEHPPGLLRGLVRPGAPSLAILALAPLALLLRGARADEPRPRPRPILLLAAIWLLGFGAVVGPVAARWSSYYYTLFAVGGAIALGLAAARLSALGWVILATALLWWHGAGSGVRAFAVGEDPWVWTSHLTPWALQRGAALTDSLERQVARLEPRPERETRFFFSGLPSAVGFQMGNGALLRALYHDPSIESYFFSQFSETTAANHPCRFLAWDGRSFAPLYPSDRDRFFQVGSDLLAMDRLEAARHAFHRSLGAGEIPLDPLYWLGWTELWLQRRSVAELVWTRFGARDDTTAWMLQMRRARQSLNDDRDTLAARRALASAIRSGIGRPEAHAVLGQLLLRDHPKYAVLELKVAAYLKPDDWVARRDLALALYGSGLDDDARLQIAQLASLGYDWRADSLLVAAARTMERRSRSGATVVEF